MINAGVLVLNRSFFPIHIKTMRRAFILFYRAIARVVNEQYRTFDFDRLHELAVENHNESIGLVNRLIKAPKIILLVAYDRMPRGDVNFTRLNIYLRDQSTCQYCGRKLPKNQVILDHVIPRSHAGKSTRDNVVCCCYRCNRKKGG